MINSRQWTGNLVDSEMNLIVSDIDYVESLIENEIPMACCLKGISPETLATLASDAIYEFVSDDNSMRFFVTNNETDIQSSDEFLWLRSNIRL